MRLLEVPGLRGVLFLVALGVIASSGHGQPIVVDDDFSNGAQGWTGFFVDHPPGVEGAWQMEAGVRPLPEELGIAATGFMITGNNHSDDLGMALKKRLGPADGIAPNTTYWVDFDITFASNAADDAVGVGGAPGVGVYLKAGAAPVEPAPVLEPASEHLRPNVNVGFQSLGGQAATQGGPREAGRQGQEQWSRAFGETDGERAVIPQPASQHHFLAEAGGRTRIRGS